MQVYTNLTLFIQSNAALQPDLCTCIYALYVNGMNVFIRIAIIYMYVFMYYALCEYPKVQLKKQRKKNFGGAPPLPFLL